MKETDYIFKLLKLHLHNVEEYQINDLKIKKIEGNFEFKIKDVKVIIPMNQFEKICENMDGSITFEKQSFKIPKKSNRSSDIEVILKDKEGNKSSTLVESIHYNSTEHVELINYLRNVETFVSLGVNNNQDGIALNITNSYNLNQNSNSNNLSFQSNLDFEEKNDKENFENIKFSIKYILENTNDKIYLHGKEFSEEVLGFDLPNDRVLDLEQYITRDEFNLFINDEKNSWGRLFDKSQQRSIDIPKIIYFEDRRIEFIDKINEIKENINKVNSLSLEFDKFDEFKFIKESEFTTENENKIKNYIKDFDFDVGGKEIVELRTMFLFAIENEFYSISDLILERFEEYNKTSDRPRQFYLDENKTCLKLAILDENEEQINKLLKYSKSDWSVDSSNFVDKLKHRKELVIALICSSIKDELKLEIISKIGLEEFSKDILKETSLNDLSK